MRGALERDCIRVESPVMERGSLAIRFTQEPPIRRIAQERTRRSRPAKVGGDVSSPNLTDGQRSSSRSIPTSTARSVRSSSHSIGMVRDPPY
jgi:hypothetical protein